VMGPSARKGILPRGFKGLEKVFLLGGGDFKWTTKGEKDNEKSLKENFIGEELVLEGGVRLLGWALFSCSAMKKGGGV